MFDEILVATDETDLAESPIRYRTTWRARFAYRLESILRELFYQSGSATPADPDADEVYVPTNNATSYALDLAVQHGARLHILFTIDTRKYDTSIGSAVEPLQARGQRVLDDIVERADRAGVPIEVSTDTGTPLELVLDYIEEHGVDLVVMNVHNYHRLHRLLFGTPARKLARRADVPVLVVPMIEPEV